jgi:linoleoyl-CoA desaturase
VVLHGAGSSPIAPLAGRPRRRWVRPGSTEAARRSSGPLARGRTLSTTTPLEHLTEDDLAQIAREFDAIRDEVLADLGEADAQYIRRLVATQRRLEAAARALLLLSRFRPALVTGTALLTVSKVLENMEIGHNLMHGQWDWMRDPHINSRSWEWDAASTARSWKHAHNFEHHTYTNVTGKDRDLGYSAMRVEADQPWSPVHLLQPLYFFAMAAVFEWGIALFDVDIEAAREGRKPRAQAREELLELGRKARRQVLKDYVAFPLLAGRAAPRARAGIAVANLLRNVWVHTIVFCGHLPEGVPTFTEEQFERESRGGWYVRQLLGSCNLEGTPLFHLMTGNLSHQIEHHLYPDLPSNRLARIAPRVRAVCERHGLPYTSGRLGRQYGSVYRRVLRFALPGGGRSAPVPGSPATVDTSAPALPAAAEPLASAA